MSSTDAQLRDDYLRDDSQSAFYGLVERHVDLGTMDNPPSVWRQIEPLLDEAIESLDKVDRAAVLGRYLDEMVFMELPRAERNADGDFYVSGPYGQPPACQQHCATRATDSPNNVSSCA